MICIIIFGDSISFGKGEFPKIGWSGRLKKFFEAEDKDIRNRIFNLGISGDDSNRLLNRIESEIKARINNVLPDDSVVVMIAIGVNDCIGIDSPDNLQIKPKYFEKNIKEIIRKTKKYTDDIILVGLLPIDENKTNPYDVNRYLLNKYIKDYNNIIKKCSNQQDVFFINMYDNFIGRNYDLLFYDGVHPNKKGYDLMYNIIKKFIIENITK